MLADFIVNAPLDSRRELDIAIMAFKGENLLTQRGDPNGDSGRFAEVLGSIAGRRVIYKELTGINRRQVDPFRPLAREAHTSCVRGYGTRRVDPLLVRRSAAVYWTTAGPDGSG